MALDSGPVAPRPRRGILKASSVVASLFLATPAMGQGGNVNYNQGERSTDYVKILQVAVSSARRSLRQEMETINTAHRGSPELEAGRKALRDDWTVILSDLKLRYVDMLLVSGYASNSREVQEVKRICDSNTNPL